MDPAAFLGVTAATRALQVDANSAGGGTTPHTAAASAPGSAGLARQTSLGRAFATPGHQGVEPSEAHEGAGGLMPHGAGAGGQIEGRAQLFGGGAGGAGGAGAPEGAFPAPAYGLPLLSAA